MIGGSSLLSRWFRPFATDWNTFERVHVLSRLSRRTLSENLICQCRNIQHQIQTSGQGHALRKAKVTVCELLGGEVVILRNGKALSYTPYQLGERPLALEDEKSLNQRVDRAAEEASEAQNLETRS